MNRTWSLVVLIPFAAFTVWCVARYGAWGFVVAAVDDAPSAQVAIDLCIAMALALGWLIRDARRRGLSPWPWVLAALPLGSLSPLAYLAWTGWRGEAAPAIPVR